MGVVNTERKVVYFGRPGADKTKKKVSSLLR